MNRRVKQNAVIRHHQTLDDVLSGWAWLARGVLFCMALVVLLIQWYTIIGQPRYRGSLLILAIGGILLWRRRSSIGRVRSQKIAWLARCFVFPGYLFLLGCVTALMWFWLQSLSFAMLASVFYLGWFIARRCDREGWRQLAPVWLILFTLCFVNEFDIANHSSQWLNDFVSFQLDRIGILHRINTAVDLKLIESQTLVSLDSNEVLSGYLLFGLSVCLVGCFRLSIAKTLFVLPTALVLARMLVPAKMIVATWVDSRFYNLFAFLVIVTIFFSTICLVTFFQSTRCLRHSENRIASMFYRWMSADWGSVMFGGEFHRIKSGTTTQLFHWSVVRRFLIAYLTSRPWRKLIGGVPVIALIAVCVWRLAIEGTGDENRLWLKETYRNQLSHFIAKHDLAIATDLVSRLRELDANDFSASITLAEARIKAGEIDEGESIVRELIDQGAADSPSGVPLRLWMAKRCLVRGSRPDRTFPLSEVSPSNAAEAEAHLLAAIEQSPGSFESIGMYSALLGRRGDKKRIGSLLCSTTFEKGEEEIEVIRLLDRLGLNREAQQRARSLIQRDGNEQSESDLASRAYLMAEAYLICDEREQAVKVLEQAMASGLVDPKAESLNVQLRLELCRSEAREHKRNRVEHFRRVRELAPESRELIGLAARFLFSPDPSLEAEFRKECRSIVEQSIDSPGAPSEMFVILGTGAASQGRLSVSEKYLRRAFELGDRTPELLNNLAWVISQISDADLAFALELANQAVASDSRSRDALLTRADIQISRGNHLDAIADLERIYQGGDDSNEIIDRLMICYKVIGELDIANGLKILRK